MEDPAVSQTCFTWGDKGFIATSTPFCSAHFIFMGSSKLEYFLFELGPYT